MRAYQITQAALDDADLTDEFRATNSATYCPEDDKIRLYLSRRVSRDSFLYLKKCGFVATPKQDCSFAAVWSIAAEDVALELIADDDDIGDEDYSPAERAADRAERFAGYRENRRRDASDLADRYDAGPSAMGYQSAARAERMAARRDRVRDRSLCQWDKAEYWQHRTAGVISHALHKSSAHVRRGRVLTIEKELRALEERLANSLARYNHLKTLCDLEGLDDKMQGETEPQSVGWQAVYRRVQNGGHGYAHPRNPDKADTSLYCLMIDRTDPLSAREILNLYFEEFPVPPGHAEDSYTNRTISHLRNRLAYENAMLDNEGGKASEVEMEVGGWIGRHQIHKINRSPVTKRIVSVGIWKPHPWRKDQDGAPVMYLEPKNIERLGAEAYRAPTEEERAAFKDSKLYKAATKNPSMVNPTPEDAQRLQDHLNRKNREEWLNRPAYKLSDKEPTPKAIELMTQADFSARLGSGLVTTTTFKGLRLRMKWSWGYNDRVPHVVVITDKPQKALPIDWAALEPQPEPAPVVENPALAPIDRSAIPAGSLF